MQVLSHHYDIVIVGAGPAGLAAAQELLHHGISGQSILIVDRGVGIADRVLARNQGNNDHNTSGFGGAGLFSDGKLYLPYEDFPLFPDDKELLSVWDALPNSSISEAEGRDLFKSAFELISRLGFPMLHNSPPEFAIRELRGIFNEYDIFFEYYEINQIDPNYLPDVIHSFEQSFIDAGIAIRMESMVDSVLLLDNGDKQITLRRGRDQYFVNCKYLILAVGKIGTNWIKNQARDLHLATCSRPIELGCRVEVPHEVLEKFTRVHRDLKLLRKLNAHALAKTFCVCTNGKVAPCYYDDILLLGGYSDASQTPNTNFALLVKMDLPVADPLGYGYSVVRSTNLLGNDKPLLQRLGDLHANRSTTEDQLRNNSIKTTLPTYQLGDIGQAFPHFVIKSILDTLTEFAKVIPGIDHPDNLLSAPCLEFCYPKFVVSKTMETNQQGIFVAGDCAGYIKGIIPAMASGILAGRGVAKAWRA